MGECRCDTCGRGLRAAAPDKTQDEENAEARELLVSICKRRGPNRAGCGLERAIHDPLAPIVSPL